MLYDITVPQYTKMLRNLKNVLAKGQAYATSKKVEPEVILDTRLAIDQFPLIEQVQVATDSAKLCVARLTGKEAPKHNDEETTLAELNTRIDEVIAYMGTVSAKDFDGAAEKRITTPRWEGKTLSGLEFAVQHATPNVYFHVTTAYAILRHLGVEIGKKDFLGEMPYRQP